VNKNVPTLLGIAIILLVVLVILGIYQIAMYNRMATGQTVVGTTGGKILTGVEPPTEEISPSEVLSKQLEKPPATVSPAQVQAREGRQANIREGQERRASRSAQRRSEGAGRRRAGQ